ncbi:CoA-binding protein [Lichenihabitans sp. Uapishka_5]|uniref:CoA-binding protein n=1 Tax=Lichenihabitans sp. Uapishka_5 TaxID=3037302 RepID=UPI0029E7E3DE|nr:CoA-binding protein [Lichenihabitans sp. Uapishka_5]MDX7953932.1 CoA-binding protein [Lichenihabitans sp. Uapishka_5]
MTFHNPSDAAIAAILRHSRSIALVGASANPARPSAGVLRWLLARGYAVTAVNPGLEGPLFGAPVVARLEALEAPVDMVDVFRNSAAAGAVVDEVLALPWRPKAIWMQLGVHNPEAAAQAEAAGITVVMDRCPVIEAGRLPDATPQGS